MASVIKPPGPASDIQDLLVRPTAQRKRYDTSLCFLTRRLSEMLRCSSDRVVDLNAIAQALRVPKRRLYDVTNVLEGIALARKTSKNHIEWLGTPFGALSLEITNLIHKERKLDELIKSCTCQINQMCQNEYNQRFAYLTYEDVQRVPLLKEQTVIVIKGPAGTKLEVPHPKESLQVYLSSTQGPIEAFLCTDDTFPKDTAQTRVLGGGGKRRPSDDGSPGPCGPPRQSSSAASTPDPPESPFHQLPADEPQSCERITPPPKVPPEEQPLTEAEAEGVTDSFPSVDLKPTPVDVSV